MNAALEVEWLKMLRAPVYRGGAAAVTAGVPTGTAALFWLAGLGIEGYVLALQWMSLRGHK